MTTNVERTLGRMEAQIEELMKMTAGQTVTINHVAHQYDQIDRRLSHTEEVLKEVGPLARDFGKLRERSTGFLFALTLVWSIIGGLMLWVGSQVWDWIVSRVTG